MTSELIVFPDGTVLRRLGECDGCVRADVPPAQCCTYVMVPDRDLSDDELNWLQLHGLDESIERGVRMETPCSALVDGQCELFGQPGKPTLCSNYPELPGMDPGCAFTFEFVSTTPKEQ